MDRELTELQKQYFKSIESEKKEQLLQSKSTIDKFKEKVSSLGIDQTKVEFDYLRGIGVVAKYPNLLLHLNPELKVDKDGLINFQNLKGFYEHHPMNPGYLFGEDFAIMASRFFRRGMSQVNGFAPRFVERFWQIEDTDSLSCSIRIELDCIIINSEASIELDTWYGANFNRDIASIKNGLVKLVPPSTLDETDLFLFFSNVIALDIEWGLKNENGHTFKNFQAEEFKTEDVLVEFDGSHFHPSRYIHSEYDINKACFRHLDGAIHFYLPEDYQLRRYSDFNYNSKSSKHIKGSAIKLFRLDGELEIERWIEFVSQFMSGNPLVFEYFEGSLPEHLIKMIEAKVKSQGGE